MTGSETETGTETETETITVAEVSDGPCGTGRVGKPVDLPVVELLTGRGFITGKSGSGKSNTASVVAEKLLDSGFGLLIVDIDGEYYGLKEEYEILHAGADEECDVQVTVDHAEKLATLALEGNVPIILDVSSFLDDAEARELLTAVSKHLFAKGKRRKQPFLLLVEEVHEYIPENGAVGECGKMLIKIGKRGRKHGLGIVGISQRPADVKKDFITQCDWLVWHRLTWNNDTKVVRRILDGEHSEAVEDLDDGEAFLMTDWADSVRRVQFDRKRTFDAGATPGLDDFERPDLKSVSDDLVSELREISEDQQERDDRIEELREELDRKNSRIAELETELSDARDMRRLAEQFTNALLENVEGTAPGRTEQERMRRRRERTEGDRATGAMDSHDARDGATGGEAAGEEDDGQAAVPMTWPGGNDGEGTSGQNSDGDGSGGDDDGEGSDDGGFGFPEFGAVMDGDDGADVNVKGNGNGNPEGPSNADTKPDSNGSGSDNDGEEGLFGMASLEGGSGDAPGDTMDALTRGFDAAENPLGDRATDAFERGGVPDALDGSADPEGFARRLRGELSDLDARTLEMLRYYRDHGPGTPMDALAAAGREDRTEAYARNRRLRVRGLVEHVGRGQYAYRLPALVREYAGDGDVERVESVLSANGAEKRAESSAD